MRSAIAWRGRRWRRRSLTFMPRARQEKVKSATFFTAQVDFTEAGDLKLFTGPKTMGLLDELTKDKGYLDGRYMAATFNLLRGRDLIWNYVVNNYLLGEEPPPFDLLYWNSDTTNLPAGWHRDYLEDALQGEQAGGKGRDHGRRDADRHRCGEDPGLRPGRARGPYRAAAKRVEDHGPFRGPKRFVLAGSGHIAGVVNPPAAQKYQYWVNEAVRHAASRSSTAPRSTRAAGGRTGSNGSRRRIRRR